MEFFLIVILVTIVKFVNAAIIVQAPKYVPKSQLENIVKNYYHQINRLKAMSNQAIEIEIPVIVPQKYRFLRRSSSGIGRRRKYNKPRKYNSFRQNRQSENQEVTTTPTHVEISTDLPIALMPSIKYSLLPAAAPPLSLPSLDSPLLPNPLSVSDSSLPIIKPPEDTYVEIPNLKTKTLQENNAYQEDHLKRVEEQLENLIIRLHKNLKIVENARKAGATTANKMDPIYKEDVEKALKDLEDRLLNSALVDNSGNNGGGSSTNGQKPATLNDLTHAVEKLERHIVSQSKIIATSTPPPYGEESLLIEALKPVYREEFEAFMNNAQNNGVQRMQTLDKTRKQFELNLLNRNPRSFGEGLLRLLREKLVIPKPNIAATAEGISQRTFDVQEDDDAPPDIGDKVIPVKSDVPELYKDIFIESD